MFSWVNYLLLSVILFLYSTITCTSDRLPPSLVLYSPGVPEYSEVLVKRVDDELHLVCELRGDATPRMYVWNYMPDNVTSTVVESSLTTMGPAVSSNLTKMGLQVSDSGHYMCSSPPFSVTKYIIVQSRGPKQCALGAFWCGSRCVLADYVCDGRRDCLLGEDEAPAFCPQNLCQRSDKLNCSGGRCIPAAACCRPGAPPALCVQPACCDQHPRYSRIDGVGGYVEEVVDPPLFEDRHAPDDYGFIQSTIYTVTACALIFMIAVVLLVSAICKMHMKRAALRSYAHAERATRHHYNLHYAQAHRFPPCYEASRLLEAAAASPSQSPQHATAATAATAAAAQPAVSRPECPDSPPSGPPDCPVEEPTNNGFGLARLSSIFSSRYRQVPTQPDVEMTNVRSTSLNNSPTRNRTLDNYRSPTYCDLNAAEFYFTNPEASDCGRDLNYMATPVDFFRRRAMRRNTLERVMDQIDRQRLTLQLGRFQFTLPTFGRRASTDRRPDTPNVAEINIEDLDFVRLNSNDTYTLNGRTIRLLGANFENYPVMPDGSVRPPPYTEAMRYKLYGPPPEYLSREGLNNPRENRVDQDAQTNVEMPPCYDDLASGGNPENNAENINNNNVIMDSSNDNNNVIGDSSNVITDSINVNNNVDSTNTVETINSIIDNLPAIDSDFNANDSLLTGVINSVDNAVVCNGNE